MQYVSASPEWMIYCLSTTQCSSVQSITGCLTTVLHNPTDIFHLIALQLLARICYRIFHLVFRFPNCSSSSKAGLWETNVHLLNAAECESDFFLKKRILLGFFFFLQLFLKTSFVLESKKKKKIWQCRKKWVTVGYLCNYICVFIWCTCLHVIHTRGCCLGTFLFFYFSHP